DVAEVAVGDGRRAPEERAAGAPAVARSLPAGRERLGEGRAQADAARLLVAHARGLLERGDGVLLHAAAERELEEAAGAIARAPLGRDLRGPGEGREPVGRDAAPPHLALVQIDDVPRRLGERREAGEQRLHLAGRDAREAGLAV